MTKEDFLENTGLTEQELMKQYNIINICEENIHIILMAPCLENDCTLCCNINEHKIPYSKAFEILRCGQRLDLLEVMSR